MESKIWIYEKNVIELTSDFTSDLETLLKSENFITTPEKWDVIFRNWHHRSYVKKVNLIIIDEIQVLTVVLLLKLLYLVWDICLINKKLL